MKQSMHADVAIARLLQLASPALPVGGYSYSQGLEWAIEQGIVRDAPSAGTWIGDALELVVAHGDAAVLARLLGALERGDVASFAAWNLWFAASRETSELRAETEQMGGSLLKLLRELGLSGECARTFPQGFAPVTLPAAYAFAARAFGVASDAAILAFAWSWVENQVLVAMKCVPLGQAAGQRLLFGFGPLAAAAARTAQTIGDDDVSSFAPGLALASSWHETQYSRLFRS